jgi:nicotinamidase-related amidase
VKTLVIVDMQPGFIGVSEKPIIPNVIKSVQYAIRQGWPIVVVEFEGYGETEVDVMAEVLKSPQYEIVTKHQCSGGEEVSEACHKRGWPNNFVVCGVYGDQCVSDTIATLVDIHGTVVDIIKNAVYPDCVVDDDYNALINLISINELPQPNVFIRARQIGESGCDN